MITPRGGFAPTAAYRSGARRKSTTSLISCLTPSYPATSPNRVVGRSASMIFARDLPNPPIPPIPPVRDCCVFRPIHMNKPMSTASGRKPSKRVTREFSVLVAVISTRCDRNCGSSRLTSSAVGIWLVNRVPSFRVPETSP